MQTVALIYLPRGRQTSSAFEPHGLEDGLVIVVSPPVLSSGDMVGPSVVGPAGLVRSSVDVSAAVVVVVVVVAVVVVIVVVVDVVVVVVVGDVVVVVAVVVVDDATVVVDAFEVVIGTPVAVVNICAGKQQSSVESKLGKLVLSQPRGYSEGQ